ncbi:MAG: NAD(P)/FAD-dependent oxidoreductase [Thermoanaerobaculia bacterium]|jgi:protoporphyrinogen oxidase
MSKTIIIGAGPAGLTAANELLALGRSAEVYEKDAVVGGISRTAEYRGYRFDIGGHRFFTKIPAVQKLWEEVLGEDFLERPRLSRIYYNDRFFDYPLKPLNALRGLGPIEAGRVGLSYLWAQWAPHPTEDNFEEWVSNRFGRRLYEVFFKTYTEKVWGMPCTEISADWAAQRIKNLDLFKAVKNSLIGSVGDREVITTLIDRFHYPRLGPGMMWERLTARLRESGTPVHLETPAKLVHHRDSRITAVTVEAPGGEGNRELPADHVISSMPLRELLSSFCPPPPAEILQAASRLRYRDFLTVVLIVKQEEVFPDNWIYIHSPDVRVGRVQNFGSWSPEMVPDASTTSLGLEYFVQQGDDLWSSPDEALLELAARELAVLGLVSEKDVVDGTVVRMPKAYPVYDDAYKEVLALIRGYLAGFPNLQVIGRNGQHRYNNQDHSMVAGMLAARNVAGETHDVWAVNVEQQYHEEVADDSRRVEDRLTPERLKRPELEELIGQAFARFDPVALGTALGSIAALLLLAGTAVLLLEGGDPAGPTLSLLGQYLTGYQVSWTGALIGFIEAGVLGFGLGWLMANSINLLVGVTENWIRRRLEIKEVFDPLSVGES